MGPSGRGPSKTGSSKTGSSKTGPSASDGWQGCFLVFDTFISLKTI
jgi:hypothetical protein